MLSERLIKLNEMKQVQKDSMGNDPGDYMVGMYNGIEFALCVLEDREPKYLDCKIKDDLFEGIEEIEVTVPENYTTDIYEEEKKDLEYMDGLNAQY